MDIEGVREALRRESFTPFVIRLADGRSQGVPHPEFVALAPRRVIVVARDNTWSDIEPRLVVSLIGTAKTARRSRLPKGHRQIVWRSAQIATQLTAEDPNQPPSKVGLT